MIEFHWEILSLYTAKDQDLNDVVKRATWRRIAREESWAVDIFRDTVFESADAAQFVSYPELDQDTIVSWIQQLVDVAEIDQQLTEKLQRIKDPAEIREKTRPWDDTSLYSYDDWYVLFHQGSPVWGPIHWNSDSFNNALERVGLQRSFPGDIHVRQRRVLPTSAPLVVDAATNTMLYKCELANSQPLDSIFDADDQLEWNLNVWPVIGTYLSVDRPLQAVRDRLRAHVEGMVQNVLSEPFAHELSGIGSVSLRSGPVQSVWLLTQQASMADGTTVTWQGADNAWHDLDRASITDLLGAVQQRQAAVSAWHKNLEQSITAAETVDQLRALDTKFSNT